MNGEFQAHAMGTNWTTQDSLISVYPFLALLGAGLMFWLYHQLHRRAYSAALRQFSAGA
jgi:hypothetical protein